MQSMHMCIYVSVSDGGAGHFVRWLFPVEFGVKYGVRFILGSSVSFLLLRRRSALLYCCQYTLLSVRTGMEFGEGIIKVANLSHNV